MARGDEADVERIRRKNGGLFVTARALDLRQVPVADLDALDALVEIAKKYETVVLELPDELGADFVVWDDGLAFRYRHGPRPAPVAPPAPPPPPPPAPPKVQPYRPPPEGRVVFDALRRGPAPG